MEGLDTPPPLARQTLCTPKQRLDRHGGAVWSGPSAGLMGVAVGAVVGIVLGEESSCHGFVFQGDTLRYFSIAVIR